MEPIGDLKKETKLIVENLWQFYDNKNFVFTKYLVNKFSNNIWAYCKTYD